MGDGLGQFFLENQQVFQQEIQQKQNELMDPIYKKAQETVQKLAKEAGLIAVFDSTSALYFDETAVIDLTASARKALNIAEGRTLQALNEELQAAAAAEQQQK